MFSPEDYEFMAMALKLAEAAAECGEVPIGAVIVLNGEQIASGQNRMEELQSATAHAEILAINKAGEHLKNWRLDGATLYVSLEPCQMCWGAIKNSRISRVVFAAKDTRTETSVGTTPCACPLTESGIMEKESVEILQNFFRNVRKIKKMPATTS
jgi:tRNA(adenine34) deaminase